MVCNSGIPDSYFRIVPVRLVHKVPLGNTMLIDVDRNGYERVALGFDRVHNADQEPSLEK